jgi:hypothetical protein
VTIRLALVIYFVLWLAWLVPWYIRRYHSGHGEDRPAALTGRTLLYVIIWVTIVIAIATAWRVTHPGAGS